MQVRFLAIRFACGVVDRQVDVGVCTQMKTVSFRQKSVHHELQGRHASR